MPVVKQQVRVGIDQAGKQSHAGQGENAGAGGDVHFLRRPRLVDPLTLDDDHPAGVGFWADAVEDAGRFQNDGSLVRSPIGSGRSIGGPGRQDKEETQRGG
jgi:hypothetical protein